MSGVPTVAIHGDYTPITDPLHIDTPPEVGDPPHLDIEATLREMHLTMQTLRKVQTQPTLSAADEASSEHDAFITTVAKKVSKKNMWGKILMWTAITIGSVFSAGMTYQLAVGANATDDEVISTVHHALVEHNGGKDPATENGNGIPIGHHPEMRDSIKKLQEDTSQVKLDVGVIKTAQKKSQKRGEYQYEFSRWQGKVMECKRTRRCKPPQKPKKLDDLEAEIHLGNFD